MERLTRQKSIADFVKVLGEKDVLIGEQLEQEQTRTLQMFEEIRMEKMAYHARSLEAQKNIFITC